MVAREHNRRAKLKQTLAGQFVQVEPAVRFSAAKGNYHQFTIIVLATFDEYRSAWIREHALICAWQPRLNHPFVHCYLLKRAAGYRITKLRKINGKPPPNFKRLFLRLHRRTATLKLHPASLVSKEHAFAILIDLTQTDIKSFEASKHIRSQHMTDLEVYALWRMAVNLEQPGSCQAHQIRASFSQWQCSSNSSHPLHSVSRSPVLLFEHPKMVASANTEIQALNDSFAYSGQSYCGSSPTQYTEIGVQLQAMGLQNV